jgi:cation transport ATPase
MVFKLAIFIALAILAVAVPMTLIVTAPLAVYIAIRANRRGKRYMERARLRQAEAEEKARYKNAIAVRSMFR